MIFKTFGTGHALRYVACGDSGTAGTGASSSEKSYAHLIASELSKNNTVSYANSSTNGALTKNFILRQLPQILSVDPDIIVLSIGINDAFYLYSCRKIIKNIKLVLRELEEKTHAKIFMASLPDITGAQFFPYLYILFFNRRARLINAELKKLENGRTKVVDIYTIDWSSTGGREKIFAADGLHLNNRGHEKLARIFLEHMQGCAILKRSNI